LYVKKKNIILENIFLEITRTWSAQFHCAADNNQKLNGRNRVLLSSDRGKGGKSLRTCVGRSVSATWRTIVRASAHQLATVGSEMKTFHSDKALPGSVLDQLIRSAFINFSK
jgi:hypothetical protein